MKNEESLHQKEYKRDCYKLLADCYYVPDERLLTMLHGSDRSGGNLYSEITRNLPATSEIESLRIDYSKLFLGPYSILAPPYGSIYLENKGAVMGDSTIDVKNKYAEEGLNVCLKEVPDHIAI